MLIRRSLPMLLMAGLFLAACGQKADAPVAAEQARAGSADTAAPALPRTAAPSDARVYFVAPADGDTVSNPVRVEFGIEGMSVVKAGDDTPLSGHHHLIVDAELPDLGVPIPASDNYIHFGDGSTSTELTLAPGEHTLRLLLGDHLHIPHDPPVASETITITVK